MACAEYCPLLVAHLEITVGVIHVDVRHENRRAAVLQYVILHIRACGSWGGEEVMAPHHNAVVVAIAATIGAAETAT